MSSTWLLTAVAILIIVALFRRNRWLARLRGCSLPPGPVGWPVVGNLYDLSEDRPWLIYTKWAREYGDLVFLQAFNTPMLIVQSVDVALDLMDKRSAIYSDRIPFTIDQMTAWEFNLGLMPYGARWRAIRRNIHEYFNRMVTPRYHNKQSKHIHTFLRQCLHETGTKFNPVLVRQWLAATILDVTYGIEIVDMNDEYVKLVVEALEALGESKKPGKYWVDYIPWLQYIPAWVPGAASAKFATEARPIVEEMVNKPFYTAQEENFEKDCVALDLLVKIARMRDGPHKKAQETHAKHAAGVVYAAASETTFSLMQSFFCAMAMHPSIQKTAREELDLVVGPGRLPTYGDQVSLPYINAILLECIRWLPAAPLGVSHSLMKDDYYNGYFIPAGTIIIPNAWHMLHSIDDYPEPERFNPGRYLKDGVLDPSVRDPTTIAFGFGRRICPGRHFAKDSAFLAIASILHAFDILPSVDENGKELDLTPQLVGSLIAFPAPLNYRLKLRSEEFGKLVTATASMS